MAYNPTQYNYFGAGNANLNLTGFVNHMNIYSTTELDCQDFAAILKAALEANGMSARFDKIERWENGQWPGAFYYWPLCMAGSDSSDSGDQQDDLGNYSSDYFNFHSVVMAASYRYDAAASYLFDANGDTYKNPVAHWDVTGHWQTYSGGKWHGLVYGTTTAAYQWIYGQELPWHLVTGLGPTGVE